MPFYCSVCDRELRDDERECPVCGAPSTRVMHDLDHGDEEWESLADRGAPRLLREGDPDYEQPAGRRGGRAAGESQRASEDGSASDPEWDDLVARFDDPDERGRPLYAKERAAGTWRRLRSLFGR
jgi:hypothetical protein